MKKCPYCAEEIQEEAIKCKHCGEFFTKLPKEGKWYFKTRYLVTGFLFVGPFALPLLWFNPKYSRAIKIIFTALVLILSFALGKAVVTALNSIGEYYTLAFSDLGITV